MIIHFIIIYNLKFRRGNITMLILIILVPGWDIFEFDLFNLSADYIKL
jgi:hypothetical protein